MFKCKETSKGFDVFKFYGTVKFEDSALEIQKRLRNGWE